LICSPSDAAKEKESPLRGLSLFLHSLSFDLRFGSPPFAPCFFIPELRLFRAYLRRWFMGRVLVSTATLF